MKGDEKGSIEMEGGSHFSSIRCVNKTVLMGRYLFSSLFPGLVHHPLLRLYLLGSYDQFLLESHFRAGNVSSPIPLVI